MCQAGGPDKGEVFASFAMEANSSVLIADFMTFFLLLIKKKSIYTFIFTIQLYLT